MVNHLAKANFILGYLDVRFNQGYGSKDRKMEVQVWSSELAKFSDEQLNDTLMRDAIDYYVDVSHNKGKAPTVDQFCQALRKVSFKEHPKIEQKNPDWLTMFENSNNEGKFKFFFRNPKASSLCRYYAKEWFEKHTSFSNENINQIINGKLPQ